MGLGKGRQVVVLSSITFSFYSRYSLTKTKNQEGETLTKYEDTLRTARQPLHSHKPHHINQARLVRLALKHICLLLIDSFQRLFPFLITRARWQQLGIAIAHFFYLQATNNNKIYKR